ncbi:MAG: hypothetical protein V3V06_04075 [Dehalococcoidia bacterium]
MPSSSSVLLAALWLSAVAAAVVMGVSLSAGASPAVSVLRGVGAFTAFVALGLLAAAVTGAGLAQPAPGAAGDEGASAEPAGGPGPGGKQGSAAALPALEPEVMTAAEVEERANEAA